MGLRPKLKRRAWIVGIVMCLALAFGLREFSVRAARSENPRNPNGAAGAMHREARAAHGQQATGPSQTHGAIQWPATAARPLPVAHQSLYFEWTAGDAMDTNVLKQLAHNELEYQRLVEENARIIRRQLVYRKEPIDALVQRARAAGAPLRQLMVPGLDAQEFVAELTMAELHPSGIEGAFAGYLSGRPDSMVTIAFKGGREAFTVISPSDAIYLQGDPREPGEVIVKSIDPARYVPGVCGTPLE